MVPNRNDGVQNRKFAVPNRDVGVPNRNDGVQDREFVVPNRDGRVPNRNDGGLRPEICGSKP
ncbi:hypothetical protein [Kaistella chaponensis]|uniref:hypothetical protein n=1 Tax=Kaistella chaponensis TaxID=713588 RepID=UPI00097145C6|nr:hypothetical protein [Kaistella chaponensis]